MKDIEVEEGRWVKRREEGKKEREEADQTARERCEIRKRETHQSNVTPLSLSPEPRTFPHLTTRVYAAHNFISPLLRNVQFSI